MENTQVAVIGSGYLGRFHAEKYAHLPGVELVGVVDTNYSKAEELASQVHTTPFVNYQDVLTQVQAVSIVVPTPLHSPIAKDFLEHDINILLEKPMTTTLKEANELIAIAKERDLILQVGHLERFNPAYLAVESIVENPLFIESHRLNSFQERGTEVDVILDIMIHDIDIILNLVNSEVTRIHAVGIPVISSTIDIANARLEFESGCVVNATASRISDKSMRKLRLFQHDAYISIDFADHKASVYRKIEDEGRLPYITSEKLEIESKDSLEEEIKSFLKAVTQKSKPLVPGEAGLRALRVALEIANQLRTDTRRIVDKQ
jgi:predicted dehydrogenase